MSQFRFRLDPVLTFRRNRKDQILQLMAELLKDDRDFQTREAAILEERDLQMDELRQLSVAAKYDVDRAASRRYHAGVLSLDLQTLAHQRRLLAEQIDRCRAELARADQDVKLLEKLREKQQAEHAKQGEMRAAMEREEAWLGAHWQEVSR